MKRSEFIKLMGWMGAGVTLSTPLLASCSDDDIEVNFEGKVIVIGAGASGLAATKTLLDAGIEVQVLEASSIHGGRVRKNDSFADFPMDLGGRWIHGQRAISKGYADSLGMDLTYESFRETKTWYNGVLSTNIPTPFARFYAKINSGPSGLQDVSFTELAALNNYTPDIKHLIESTATQYGASASKISAKNTALGDEKWSSGNKDYVFKDTYYDLIDRYFATYVKPFIEYDSAVKSIDYSSDKIIVVDQNDNQYEGDRVIITVPITILQSNAISFVPELAEAKTSAFQKIGMEPGMKIIMKFSQPLYEGMVIGGELCSIYNNVSYGKDTDQNIMMAFVMGDKAEHLSAMSTENAIQIILGELDEIFDGNATTYYLDGMIQDWKKEPFIQGAYSYATVGMGDARQVGAASVDNKLFFAGEAFNLNGHNATVHGAIETGIEKANGVLQSGD